MSIVLKGKPVIEAINVKTKKDVEKFKSLGIIPKLGMVQVGDRPDDTFYRNSIIKKCNALGIDTQVYNYELNIEMEEFIENLKNINNDESVHGILIFRPLPKQLDIDVIKNVIDPNKDIDCMSPINMERVFEGDLEGLVPCTPKAVMEILKYYDIPLKGSNVAVINRSLVVGKPLSMMLLAEQSTVTICHSKTKNLPEVTNKSDIIICAVGRAKFFGQSYFNTENLVIDVGINDDGNGKICGDVDYQLVKDDVKAITPVPGGVGTVTTAVLLNQVTVAIDKQL